ncbi:hypothetical protein PVAP13_8NG145300 [Panicum virgatum]|uniref:Uncharacterized protein n=1 Tax=Panicum virgatum TaxID=38727 RepID=A0A8T0PJ09_PANVG|nr:hypothetical protein PVAP13_8NG145300 [Panicum virgatum]
MSETKQENKRRYKKIRSCNQVLIHTGVPNDLKFPLPTLSCKIIHKVEENGHLLKMLGMPTTGRLLLDSVVSINVNTLRCKLLVSY